MLPSVLSSQKAIDTSIRIIDAFVAMRHFIASNAQVFQRLEVIEHHQLEMSSHLTKNDNQIAEIFKRKVFRKRPRGEVGETAVYRVRASVKRRKRRLEVPCRRKKFCAHNPWKSRVAK